MGCAGSSSASEKNYITAEIEIDADNVNKDVLIICSYEQSLKIDAAQKAQDAFDNGEETKKEDKINEELKNEEEVKTCEIKINDKNIPFSYYYKFPEKGKYKISYTFQNLIKADYLFYQCTAITSLDLSHFNSNSITNMRNMFFECKALKEINLSKMNTKNVVDFLGMFSYCESLTTLDLSSFNTQNVTIMAEMFLSCESLKYLNLSKFITQKIEDDICLSCMFECCKALEKQNIITKDQRILEQFDRDNFSGKRGEDGEEGCYAEGEEGY